MNKEELKKITHWLLRGEVGISSQTMVEIYLGYKKGKWCHPMDPSDFRRCYKMLEELPFVRSVLPKLGEATPAFSEMGKRWDELESVYNQEKDNYTAPKLYDLLQTIRENNEY
jgi:hypothetical protein